MLNILTVSYALGPAFSGGYGLQMGLFCEGLRTRGHRVSGLTVRGPNGAEVSVETRFDLEYSLRLITSTMSPFQVLKGNVHNVSAVRSAIRRLNPDVVLCGGMDFVGFNAYLAAIESGRPTLTWLGDTWLAQAWRDLAWYDRWCGFASGGPPGPKRLLRRSVGALGGAMGLSCGRVPSTFAPVAAISRFVLDDLCGTGAPVPPDTKVIPIALHPSFFDRSGEPVRHGGRRTPALRALFVGRLEMLKGPDTAIRALAEAVRRAGDVRLTLAGLEMDETVTTCRRLAAELGVADRITWAGTPNLKDLIALYRDHDVFLFPSRIVEGLGVVNCEALACGLPIIGTAHSGSADVIIPGRTGFRVDKDDAAAMGGHLADLQADRGLLERLSDEVPEAARRFAPAEVLRVLEAELIRVTNRGPQ